MDELKNRQHLLDMKRLRHGECYGFEIVGSQAGEGFLLNWHGQIHAFQNACPHTGASLNWAPHQFMDYETRFIQCGIHGALFEPDSGLCIRGPCLGSSLTRLPIRIIDEQIYLALEESAAD